MNYPASTESEFDARFMATKILGIENKGVYVDIGAGYPEFYSNAVEFRVAGWKIIAVEPLPHMCKKFRDMGYEICEYAATDRDLGKTTFEYHAGLDGLSGSCFNSTAGTSSIASYPADHRQSMLDNGQIKLIEVEALTLNTILTRHYPEIDHITILDIDVEGYELEVLRGLDLKKYNPDLMIIENYSANPRYYEFYKQIGYKMVTKAAYNEILMRDE
jgi:FkbM family methyltransferase